MFYLTHLYLSTADLIFSAQANELSLAIAITLAPSHPPLCIITLIHSSSLHLRGTPHLISYATAVRYHSYNARPNRAYPHIHLAAPLCYLLLIIWLFWFDRFDLLFYSYIFLVSLTSYYQLLLPCLCAHVLCAQSIVNKHIIQTRHALYKPLLSLTLRKTQSLYMTFNTHLFLYVLCCIELNHCTSILLTDTTLSFHTNRA